MRRGTLESSGWCTFGFDTCAALSEDLIDEFALIEQIAAVLTARPGVTVGIGDDAAVLAGDPATVVSTDMLVEDVHFRSSTSGPGDIGHKALAVNLSDIAAMGAVPVAAFVALGVPDRGVSASEIIDLYRAMDSLAASHGVTIAGGDISRAPVLTLAVTVVGHLQAGRPAVLRSGARPGDVVVVTGAIGGAIAGLTLLEHPETQVGAAVGEAVLRRARRPQPRVAEAQCLAAAGVSAMCDCSDGFAADLERICHASNVSVEVDLDLLPLDVGVRELARLMGEEPSQWAATGGDDYEIIATGPAETLERLELPEGLSLTVVGRVLAQRTVPTLRITRHGEVVPFDRLGWSHSVGHETG